MGMDLKLVNRLAAIGITFVSVGHLMLSTDKDAFEISQNMFLNTSDITDLEKEVEERKRKNETELSYKGYTMKLKK